MISALPRMPSYSSLFFSRVYSDAFINLRNAAPSLYHKASSNMTLASKPSSSVSFSSAFASYSSSPSSRSNDSHIDANKKVERTDHEEEDDSPEHGHVHLPGQACSHHSHTKNSETISKEEATKPGTHNQYCFNLVKQSDYEHFLTTLFVPSHARAAVFAIRAFNVEIAQIRDIVKNRDLGKIRMKWWKDSIESSLKGKPVSQPVCLSLHEEAGHLSLSTRWFTRLIDEREKNLDDKPFGTLQDLEAYGENTASSLLYLTLESLGIRNIHADHAASHIGKAEAIVTILRSIPYHAQHKRVYLPVQLAAQCGLSSEDVFKGVSSKALTDVAYELASAAHVHLQTARSMTKDIPPRAHKALLPAVACAAYLEKIQQKNFDVFHPELQQRNVLLPFTLVKHAFRKTF